MEKSEIYIAPNGGLFIMADNVMYPIVGAGQSALVPIERAIVPVLICGMGIIQSHNN